MSTESSIGPNVQVFPSLAALRTCHSQLLEKIADYSDQDIPAEILADIEIFRARAAATGKLITVDEDRADIQPLLNYWTSVLYGAGRQVRSAVLAPPDKASIAQHSGDRNPYRGLRAFQAEDRDLFFGRRRMVQDILEKLRTSRLIAVLGLSGSGKSSLIRAGLLPIVSEGGAGPRIVREPIVPGTDPVQALADLIGPSLNIPQPTLLDRILDDPTTLRQALDRAERPSLVTIDQFEELFTAVGDERLATAFISNVISAVTDAGARHAVVLTMRSEFDTYLARYPDLEALASKGEVRLPPLSASDLRKAIEKPAELRGLVFEPGLVDELVHEVLGEPAGLPLLQFALLKLWDKREGLKLTWDAYKTLGGNPREILARVADQTYESLKLKEHLTVTEYIFRELVRFTVGLEPTARRVERRELTRLASRENVNRMIAIWNGAGMLRITPGRTEDTDLIEVTHEALLRNWPKLVAWAADERGRQRRRGILAERAQAWKAGQKDFLSEAALDEAQTWTDLSPLEQEYMHASRAEIDAEGARRREEIRQAIADAERRLARLTLDIEQLQWRKDEERSRAMSARSRELAASALLKLSVDPELSMLLALYATTEALSETEKVPDEAAYALQESLRHSRVRQVIRPDNGKQRVVAVDGSSTFLATAGDEGIVYIWHNTDKRFVASYDAGDRPIAVGFQSESVVATTEGGVLYVWRQLGDSRASKRKEVFQLLPETAWTAAAAFSDDGKLAVGYADRLVIFDDILSDHSRDFRLEKAPVIRVAVATKAELVAVAYAGSYFIEVYSTAPFEKIATLTGHTEEILSLAFSANGRRLASTDKESRLRVWSVQESVSQVSWRSESGWITSLAFSPDGERLAVGTADGLGHMIRIPEGNTLFRLPGHSDTIDAMAYAADGTALVSTSSDRTARVWHVGEEEPKMFLESHPDKLRSIAFSNLGHIVTAADDGSAIVWDGESGKPVRKFVVPKGGATAAVFDPSGSRILVVGAEGMLAIFDLESGDALTPWRPIANSRLLSAAWSPTGNHIAVVGSDGFAGIFDVDGLGLNLSLHGHTSWVNSVAFNCDGSMVASSGDDRSVCMWRADTGRPRGKARARDSFQGAAFSLEPDVIYASNHDGWVYRCEPAKGRAERFATNGRDKRLHAVCLSPDGKWIAAACGDKTAALWEVGSGEQCRDLFGHADEVWSIAFSADGKRIGTASLDNTGRVWSADNCEELFELDPAGEWPRRYDPSPQVRVYGLALERMQELARSRLTRTFTMAECQQYLRQNCHSLRHYSEWRRRTLDSPSADL